MTDKSNNRQQIQNHHRYYKYYQDLWHTHHQYILGAQEILHYIEQSNQKRNFKQEIITRDTGTITLQIIRLEILVIDRYIKTEPPKIVDVKQAKLINCIRIKIDSHAVKMSVLKIFLVNENKKINL